MSGRVAVVTTRYGGSWDEEQVVVRRLAGALACAADVDVVVAAGPTEEETSDGAVRLLRVPAVPVDPARADALRRAVLGPGPGDGTTACSCTNALGVDRARSLPSSLQDEVVRAAGGDSPRLYALLEEGGYDAVVFVGYDRASTCYGMRAVPARCRVVLWPAAMPRADLHFAIHDPTFERPDVVLAFTEAERDVVAGRQGACAAAEVLPFALRVNMLAIQTEPHSFTRGQRPLVVARDWNRSEPPQELREWTTALERELYDEDVKLRLVGPGAVRWHASGGVHLTDSRTDVWRWMARSLAVLDPLPHRLLGREVLEAMLCGTPVLVADHGGATREHAEAGNGGLWFRTYDELAACTRALLDPDIRSTLGEQARTYAERLVGDPDHFVKRVQQVVLG